VRYPSFGGFLNFAYCKPLSSTSAFFLSSDGSQFMAHPPVKVNVAGYYQLGPVQIGPSLSTSRRAPARPRRTPVERYGNSNVNAPLESQKYDPVVLLNLNLFAKNIVQDVDVSVAAYNLLGSDYELIQPYYGGTHRCRRTIGR